jgi:predicted Zn-dependent protease
MNPNGIKNMLRNLALTLAIAASVTVAGCGSGQKVDIGGFGKMIGGQEGQFLQGVGKGLSAATLSEADEDAIGQSVGVAITNRHPLTTDARLAEYVMLVGLTVASVCPRPDLSWVFGVIESSEVNAFSGPNGYVFITRGALAQMKDEAELAGVLAHEISHVVNHDGLEMVKAAEAKGALVHLASSNSDTAQFAALADTGVETLTKQGYGKPQELKADKGAVTILINAGYDPSSYLRYLQRTNTPQPGGAVGQLMSTHPGTGERIALVQRQIQGMRPGGATLPERFAANVAPARR